MTARGGARQKNGHYYGHTRYGRGKRLEVRIPWATSEDAVIERMQRIGHVADELVGIGRPDLVRRTARLFAAAATPEQLARVEKNFQRALKEAAVSVSHAISLEAWADKYTSGELARLYPDAVKARDHSDDVSRLRLYVFKHRELRELPVVAFTLGHAQFVMRELPPMSDANRRQVAQIMGRLMHLAVNPGRLLEASPLPRGWLPKVRTRRFYPFLYPREEGLLLACKDVAEAFRLFVGVANREGMRVSEQLDSSWAQWNLEEGVFTRAKNKTGEIGFWALQPDTAEAMRVWKARNPELRSPFAYVAAMLATKACPEGDKKLLARLFRDSLQKAGVTREELHEKTAHTGRVRAHDMRATFVTLALAAGRSETWIRDRTGHKSTYMIDRYRRPARQLAELKLGGLPNLVEALGWWKGGGNGAREAPESSGVPHSQPDGRLVGSPPQEPKWRNGRRSGLKIPSRVSAGPGELEKPVEEDVARRPETAFHQASTTPPATSGASPSGPCLEDDLARVGAVDPPKPGPARATPRQDERAPLQTLQAMRRGVNALAVQDAFLEDFAAGLADDADGGES